MVFKKSVVIFPSWGPPLSCLFAATATRVFRIGIIKVLNTYTFKNIFKISDFELDAFQGEMVQRRRSWQPRKGMCQD